MMFVDTAADIATLTYDRFTPAIIEAVGELTYFVPQVAKNGASGNDITTSIYGEFQKYFDKLRLLPTNPALWPEETEGPSTGATTWAQLALQHFTDIGLVPAKIVASAEGGVGICFVAGKKYADIECLNSGAILAIISNRGAMPHAWEVEPSAHGLASAIARIAEFIKG